jgi:hypothetical protein
MDLMDFIIQKVDRKPISAAEERRVGCRAERIFVDNPGVPFKNLTDSAATAFPVRELNANAGNISVFMCLPIQIDRYN